jgi:phosphatidate cytidylyltransferase
MAIIAIGIGSALTLASVVRSLLPPSSLVQNLSARIKSWWWIAIALAIASLAGWIGLLILFAAVSFVALREFSAVAASRPADRRVTAACFFVVLPLQYALVGTGHVAWFTAIVPLASLALLPVLTALTGDTQGYLARVSECVFGIVVCVYCLSYVPALVTLPAARDGAQLPLFLILITQASDVLQYVWGKTLGSHLLAPQVSPSKTVEGLIGGIGCATALGAALSWMTPFSTAQAVAIAFLISVAGFLGGFVMSAIKRDRGIKDWSGTLPGHGGILDRVDSLWLSAPLYFYLVRALAVA